mgnify:CR=1 FL=1
MITLIQPEVLFSYSVWLAQAAPLHMVADLRSYGKVTITYA